MSDYCSCDYDPADVYYPSVRTARKEHKCYECGGAILKGEKYEYVFGVWNGDSNSFKTCQRCFDIRQWVKNNVPCFCWGHGNMIDDAKETVAEAVNRAPSETVGLRVGLLRRIILRNRFNARRKSQQQITDDGSQPPQAGLVQS